MGDISFAGTALVIDETCVIVMSFRAGETGAWRSRPLWFFSGYSYKWPVMGRSRYLRPTTKRPPPPSEARPRCLYRIRCRD